MKNKDTKLLLILLFVAAGYLALLSAGLYFIYKHNQQQTIVVASAIETQQMLEEASECYSLYLQDVGYSKKWADHKAQVETGLIPVDSLYYAIDQD